MEKPSGIAIEKTALVVSEEEPSIWVFNDENVLEKRQITTGDVRGDKILVSRGISEGERYVRQPGGQEKEGMSLRDLVQSSMAGNGPQGDR